MASLLPFNPFSELGRIRREMDDFFDKSFVSLPQDRKVDVGPAVDVYKTDNKLLMLVEAPGLKSGDIEVTATEGTLTIKGDFKPPKVPDNAKALMLERSYGSFARTFKLPVSINPEEVKAVYKDGVLEISIPLSEKHVSHNIKIDVENGEDKKNINN